MRTTPLILFGPILIFLSACTNPVGDSAAGPHVAEPETGSIEFRLSSDVAQTIAPPVDLRRDYYMIEGEGPGGRSFEFRLEDGVSHNQTVVAGTWALTVKAYNRNDELVGRGTTNVTVTTGRTARATVVIRPLPGKGTLAFSVSWSGGGYSSLGLAGTLSPEAGSSVGLSAPAKGSPIAVTESVGAGACILSVRLRQGGQTVGGFAEVLWIVSGERTAFSASLNLGTGVLVIGGGSGKAPKKQVSVSIDGLPSGPISEGKSLRVSAAVSGAGASDIGWYLNGERVGSGGRHTIRGLQAGGYTISAVAFERDGSGAASTSRSFVVEEAIPADDPPIIEPPGDEDKDEKDKDKDDRGRGKDDDDD